MAKRSIIRFGDRTTHGGTVTSADPAYLVFGKSIARVGDSVICPRCKGTFPIISGAPYMWSGQNIARHDDITACGAKLIASQSTATIDDGSESSISRPATAASPSQAVGDAPVKETGYSIRFQALDPDTGDAVSECIYILTRENGAQHGGFTDRKGFTEVIETTQPENIAVHFMFQSPKGDHIDREDLKV